MKEDIKSIWVAFVEMVLRFLNGRFNSFNEEANYLRMELDKSRIERERLVEALISVKKNTETETESPDLSTYQPVTPKYESLHVKRARLERESLAKVRALSNEAQIGLERSKTTEQLESELLSDKVN